MKILNKTFNFLFARTRATYFAKKMLIVNFKKSLEAKTVYINLTGRESYSFEISKEDDTTSKFVNNYKLLMVTGESSRVLAHFETMEEAKAALLEIENKLYDKFLTFISFLVKLAIIVCLLAFATDLVNFQLNKLRSPSKPVSYSQVNDQTQQLLNQMQAQQAVPPANPQVNVSNGSSSAQSVLDALK